MVFADTRDEGEQACRAAVVDLLSRYHLDILPRDMFIQLAIDALRDGVVSSPSAAALHIYALTLFVACSNGKLLPATDGAGERSRQVAAQVARSLASTLELEEQGFRALYYYLYDAARWRYPEIAEDVAQIALGEIFRTLNRCRTPGAFLKFAIYGLVSAATSVRRREAQTIESLDLPVPTSDGSIQLSELLHSDTQVDPIEIVIHHNLRQQLAQSITECARRHPRARFQLVVVWLKYIEGLDDQTIGQQLQKSASSIQTARSRGLKLLAAEPRCQALAVAFGFSDECLGVREVGSA